jgi:Flp pilus assembly pilin Flp
MMTLEAMRAWLRSRNFRLSRKGQNTVEYLLMLTVVVGVVLVAGVALKRFMPGLFSQIQTMISGAAGSLGQAN